MNQGDVHRPGRRARDAAMRTAVAGAIVLLTLGPPASAWATHPGAGNCKHEHTGVGDGSLCKAGVAGRPCKIGKEKGVCHQFTRTCNCSTIDDQKALLLIGSMFSTANTLLLFNDVLAAAGSSAACSQYSLLSTQFLLEKTALAALTLSFYDTTFLGKLDFLIANLSAFAGFAAVCGTTFPTTPAQSVLLSIKFAMLSRASL